MTRKVEVKTYKCSYCNGSGRVQDSSIFGPYESVGFSKSAMERLRRSISDCHICKGRGVVYEEKDAAKTVVESRFVTKVRLSNELQAKADSLKGGE